MQKSRKSITCPYCGRRLFDENLQSTDSLPVINDDGSTANIFMKCPRCKKEIAVKVQSTTQS